MSTIEDQLTGLHNRRSFLALLRRHVGFANERKTNLALLVVDIDGFARLNAAHGYDFGDHALQHVARQLREVTRAQDYAARIGDNRFALILPGVMNVGHAELAVQKLFRLLEVPFDDGKARVRMTATVGVAVCPMHASQAEFLFRQAEKSLELARSTGQRWLFPPESEEDRRFSEFWDLEIELDGAVQR
ncbi:MAG TPA: GGDEF domain-containing protein, partial [Lysobacter sp.]|nr:GGDEF domain-containing protein [Lysobacter sp.]